MKGLIISILLFTISPYLIGRFIAKERDIFGAWFIGFLSVIAFGLITLFILALAEFINLNF